MPHLVGVVALAVGAIPILYLVVALIALTRRPAATRSVPGPASNASLPAITVLKPICGLEPGLYENLRSYCEQDYPRYQIVFGAREPNDPALYLVRRLRNEFPGLAIDVVIDARLIGANYKVSNLHNMYRAARHDIIVMADSDTRVDRGYLKAIAAAFREPNVGAATCLYRASALGGLASRLGALYIMDTYMPSALVALLFGRLDFCFGQTAAVRRHVLDEIGGFAAFADHIADDYMLGQLVARRGYAVRLCPYVLDNVVAEPSLGGLFRHEVRWGRTLRTLCPGRYPFAIVSDALPITLLALLASGLSMPAFALFGAALAIRLVLHYAARARLGVDGGDAPWLIPIRDSLTFAVRIAALVGSDIQWRGRRFTLRHDGAMIARTAGVDDSGEGRAFGQARLHKGMG